VQIDGGPALDVVGKRAHEVLFGVLSCRSCGGARGPGEETRSQVWYRFLLRRAPAFASRAADRRRDHEENAAPGW
jgi:hypothetical protein